MKTCLKIIILFSIIALTAKNSVAQTDRNLFKRYEINQFIEPDSITGIEIYNSWTLKRWEINKQSLVKVIAIIKKSYATKSILLKPGHLYIKFKGAQDFKKYDNYMYDNSIVFDVYNEPSTLQPMKGLQPFSIILFKKIDWDKLK